MLDLAIRRGTGDFTLSASLTVGSGVTAVFGPSGAGKTTLARCIAGLARPDAGHITVDGEQVFGPGVDLPAYRRDIGYVFQDARLFPHLTVRANLLYGAAAGVSPDAVAEMLDIAPLLSRRPSGLSGGEAARVAIGRALLRAPRLLILDEPLAALDQRLRGQILPYLERVRDGGIPILYISHAIEEVARLATTLVLMKAGQVTHVGPVGDILSDPEIATRLGPSQAGALLEGVVIGHGDGLAAVDTQVGRLHVAGVEGAEGTRVRIRVRAEDVIVATEAPQGLSALNILPARVVAVHRGQGPGAMVRLAAGDGSLLARITQRSVARLDLTPDRPVWAIIKTSGVGRIDVGG
ncbi:molybdenum ABC transporter ATP-binding protein [Jannaschia sp. 2305UL9-9]|uniref:molybdenum ABC transporter ATP-binding protein n=1 Tax=Jannaschia sp. 2305UL9-9 TaxID=3121638 RepID=UPI003527084D